MNLSTLLQVPWRSTHPSLRWLSVAVFVLCSGGAIAIGLFAQDATRWQGAVMLYGMGLVYLWAFFFSGALLLSIDTRQLRIPGMQRQIVLALLLYGLLCIALPCGVMAMADLPARSAMATLALCSACGLAFTLMPRVVAIFIGLTPSFITALWHRFDLPGIADPLFAAWAAVVTVVILGIVVLRWRQLVLAPSRTQGWASPMVIQFRSGNWGQWDNIGDSRMLRQRPDWLRPLIDLDGTGPSNPLKTLRVALGGWYLPQTGWSYAKQLVLVVCILAVPMIGVLFLERLSGGGLHLASLMKGAIIGALGSVSVMASPLVCLLSQLWLGRRWLRSSAELPLLALLPAWATAYT
jgi:hypothetical protein